MIPKGTQAGTKPVGQTPLLTFETTEDLTVVPAQIASAFTWIPFGTATPIRRYRLPARAHRLYPFVGTQRMPHILYPGR